jgi:hypothetical protein
MSDVRVGKCSVCGIRVESDYGVMACSEHRDRLRLSNKQKMEELRERKFHGKAKKEE